MKHILVLLLVFLSGCNIIQKESTEIDKWRDQAATIDIFRDDFGVPHIYGKTDADAVFGLLYAQCEDDFNRVEQNYIWAIGRLAEIEGETALYSDLRARLYMTKEEAIANFNSSPEWLQKLCIAFADGINYYLYTHPEVKPKLIDRFEPWMPMYFSEGSIGGDIERISTKKIQRFYDNQYKSELAEVHDGLLRLNYGDHQGSNGIAISGKLTASGNSMLLINPHTSFFFRGEVHVVSEEGLNAYGAVRCGQVLVYPGFNEKTGWMHTSTGTDILDECEETIIEEPKGLSYLYGEEKRDLSSVPINLKYKTEAGLVEKKFTGYRTHHGPITHNNEDKWVATAMMWNPVMALQQSFIRTKQANHGGFKKMMDMRTNSSNNTVFADAEGNIAYYHGNFIPKRNSKLDYTKPVDGSNPDNDWKGLHEVDENILVVNPKNGWIQNCNSTPFSSAGDYSPKSENYPKYMTSYPENYRGIHAVSLLKKADSLTVDKLIDLAYDPFLPGAQVIMSGLKEAYKNESIKNVQIKEAVDLINSWDHSVSVNSIAMTLTQYYFNHYYRSGIIKKKRREMISITNYMGNESSFKERRDNFEKAVNQLREDFGTWKVEWGEYNRYQRINGDIVQQFNDSLKSTPIGMASGYWGALASFGTKKGENTKRIYGVGGNSFVAVVEFGAKVKAKTLLAGGQSGDPKSPHFDDQVIPYANAKFKTVAFYKEDVIKKAVSKYKPGEDPQ
jgi:acyl-homoserine lactone acylase PvdQ